MRRLRHGLQRTIGGGFELDAQQPIEMKFSGGQPLFQLFPARRVKFGKHLPFLHVEDDAARRQRLSAEKAAGEFFSALPGQAGERVLRYVARHSVSGSSGISGCIGKEREYMARAENANARDARK